MTTLKRTFYKIRNKNNSELFLDGHSYNVSWSDNFIQSKKWYNINLVYSYIKSILECRSYPEKNLLYNRSSLSVNDISNSIEVVSYEEVISEQYVEEKLSFKVKSIFLQDKIKNTLS